MADHTTKRIYIAGPMTGHQNHNFPVFHEAAKLFRASGWEVVNPAENFGGDTALPREAYMRRNIAAIVQCDAIAMLPGWQNSRGATLERDVAIECGLAIYDATTMQCLWRPEPTPCDTSR